MTIITKLNDKKKLLPLVVAPSAPSETNATLTTGSHSDAETAAVNIRHKARVTTLMVFLMGIMVMLMGVLAGICLYKQYLRERVHRFSCFVPYDADDAEKSENYLLNANWRDGPTYSDAFKMEDDDDSDEQLANSIKKLIEEFQREMADPRNEMRNMESSFSDLDPEKIQSRWFRETVEIKDEDDESYADIKIPDFKDGRQGRFIHDFKNNQTTIIDASANRCFVYPLDYTTTLPPNNMIDMMLKFQSGYYFPDTSVLRKRMRVILPALDESDEYVTGRTVKACDGMKIYKLEAFVSGVFKRSIAIKNKHAKFAEFGGTGIVEFDIVNFDELRQYETQMV